MSYINETDFVIENKELVYPEIITDGLQLYYDAKGKRDTDYHRDTMLDMSGNKNHGKLQNFAYEKHSGYKDGLVFDYIDDKLVRPTLDLKPDDFTFMLNGNIISFSPDGTIKRVQDGEVMERKGVNILSDTNNKGYDLTLKPTKQYHQIKSWQFNPNQGEKFYVRALVYAMDRYTQVYFSDNTVYTHITNTEDYEGWQIIERVFNANTSNKVAIGVRTSATSNWNEITLRNIQVINLTATFGVGNEPTLEEIQAEPDKWQWIPNPLDLIEAEELKGNTIGDIENIIDGLYKTGVLSGEEVYTDKADDDAVVHVEVDGKSYQHAGSGKNLFIGEALTHRNQSDNVHWEDGVLTYRRNSGNSYAGANFQLNVKTGVTYSLSLKGLAGSGLIRILDETGSKISDGHFFTGDFSMSFTPTGTLADITFTDAAAVNYTKIITNIQIEEGSTATAYEPPAPSPDYPIEIHSLHDFDVVSSVGKRNLLVGKENGNYRLNSNNGNIYPIIHKSYEDYDSVTLTGGHQLSTYSSERFTLEKGKEYITSMHVYSPAKLDLRIGGNVWSTVPANTWTRLIRTVVGTGEGQHIGSLHSRNAEALNHEIFYNRIKLEEGSLTPYSPAPEDITGDSNHPLIDKINLLLDEPLRSVGDVKDRLFRDSDGVWKIERKVGEDILDSSSSMTDFGYASYDTDVKTNRSFRPSGIHTGSSLGARTTHFVRYPGSVWAEPDGIGFRLNSNDQFHISFPNSVLGVITTDSKSVRDNKIREWLDSEKNKRTPLTIQYSLRTSKIETLSQDLQDKLNNLRSFSDSNYVYTIDGNTNLLGTVPLLDNHIYPHLGDVRIPIPTTGDIATKDAISVYPGAKIKLTKIAATNNFWRVVWVDKDSNLILRETSTANELVLTAPNGAYGMRVSYPNGSNAVIKFDKPSMYSDLSENLKPTLHAKFLYNNWYKEDRVINNLMIYNRALTNEEMLQNYKTIKRRWGM